MTPTTARERKLTRWVVLEWTEGTRNGAEDGGGAIEAWVEVGRHESNSKAEAFDAVVGSRTGRFKAIAERSWRGGRAKAQQTLVVDEPIID